MVPQLFVIFRHLPREQGSEGTHVAVAMDRRTLAARVRARFVCVVPDRSCGTRRHLRRTTLPERRAHELANRVEQAAHVRGNDAAAGRRPDAADLPLGTELRTRVPRLPGHRDHLAGGPRREPRLLVDAAERFGLINPLTLWILNTAIRHVADFSKAGVSIGVSVNLPPKVLEDEELPQIIQQALDIWGVAASSLTLEITEGSMMNNIESSIAMLSKLKALGIRLSIDDFGTGYSSLAYLRRLPVHELKIDIFFVRNIHNSVVDKQLVRTIIDLAHNFDLIAVAEGVEDQKTFDLLGELGCDVAQGFLFSQALPEADFVSWCKQYAQVVHLTTP